MFRLFKKNAGFTLDDAPLENSRAEVSAHSARTVMDYHKFHGFNKAPFDLTPDPSLFIDSASHKEALAKLNHGLHSNRGLTVITGEVGTGKTLLLHTALSTLGDDFIVAYLFNARLTPDDFLSMILAEFNIPSLASNKTEKLQSIYEFLIDCRSRNICPVLIIDDAQNLQEDTLEEIRLLANLETPEGKLIQFIITGQPELVSLLNRNSLRQLKQRIAVRHQLKALNPIETATYIRKRCEMAGRTEKLFSRSLILRIYVVSHGIPRLINAVCDALLFQMFMHQRNTPEIQDLKKVCRDLDVLPNKQA